MILDDIERSKKMINSKKKKINEQGFLGIERLGLKIQDYEQNIKKYEGEINKITRDIEEIELFNPDTNLNKNEGFLKSKFGILKFHEYYNNTTIENIHIHESVFNFLKDVYIIPEHKIQDMKEIIKECEEKRLSAKFFVLNKSSDLFEIIDANVNENGVAIGKIWKNKIIIIENELSIPKYFGLKNRKEFKAKLKDKLSKKTNFLEKINQKAGLLRELLDDLEKEEYLKETREKQFVDKFGTESYETIQKRYELRKKEIQIKVNQLNEKLRSIKTDKQFNLDLEKCKEEISSAQDTIGIYQDNLIQKNEEIEEISKKLKCANTDLETLPKIAQTGFDLLSELIINFNILSKIDVVKSEDKINRNNIKLIQKISNLIESIREEKKNEELQLETSLERTQMEISIKTINYQNQSKNIDEIRREIKDLTISERELISDSFKLITERDVYKLSLKKEDISLWFQNLITRKHKEIIDRQKFQEYTFANVNKEKTDLLMSWNIVIKDLLELYNLNLLNPLIRDEYNRPILNNLETGVNLNFGSIDLMDNLCKSIEKINNELSGMYKHFIADIVTFFSIIKDEIRFFNVLAKNYNILASTLKFGSFLNILFKINYTDQYLELKNFHQELKRTENEGTIYEKMIEIIENKSMSLIQYFSRKILKIENASADNFLDIYQYFDIEIITKDKNGQSRSALKGSGGESTGIKYLIYSLIFQNLRRKSKNRTIFLYFDEAAAVDETGINSLLEISEKLKINAILAMVDPPLIHDKRLTDYIIANGIVLPGMSEITTTLEMDEKT